jgi:YesN/AraC family two-component response regulator
MYNIGIIPENFNPRVLYVFVSKHTGKIELELHRHDHLEMKYILSGSCSYLIDGKQYKFKKGDIIFCNPFIDHIKSLENGETMAELNIGVNNFKIKELHKTHILENGESPEVNITKYRKDYQSHCLEIVNLQEDYEPGNDLILKTMVMRLIIIYLKEVYLNDTQSDGTQLRFESYERKSIVSTLKSFINKNYMKNISLDKMSKKFYLSSVYISKVFKEETGESPINYLIKVRLANAVQLLDNEEISVKYVSQMVGYTDEYYFSKLFKKYYNLSPMKYRKTMVKSNMDKELIDEKIQENEDNLEYKDDEKNQINQ